MIITFIGLVGSIITIYELFNNLIKSFKDSNVDNEKRVKIILCIANLIFIVIILGFYFHQYNINAEMKSIERQAYFIINKTEFHSIGDKRGYVYECFVFLEKYKDEFPESYKLATDYVQKHHIFEQGVYSHNEGHVLDDACATMRGFISGIAIVKKK